MKKSIIKIRDLKFKYDNEIIFDDLDLEVYEGSFTFIVGPSSSGKTTLIKIISGSLKASGYINIDGYLLSDYFINRIQRDLGICFNDDILFDTVRDALSFSLENLQYTKKEIIILINNLSKKFKIDNILDKSFDEITLSEKTLVSLAGVLIYNPKILILDDILVNLTTDDKKLVLKILKEYQKEKKLTIIIFTKSLEDTLYGDRIIVLDKGKVLTEGTLSNIYKDDYLERLGYELPFIVRLSQNLMLYDLLDEVYFTEKEVIDKLWP